MYGTYWLDFGVSKIFMFRVQSTSMIVIFYVQIPFMIIIHVSVHLGLLSNRIFNHFWYASIIIIIDFHLVILHNCALIVLGSITINENSIPLLRCRHATPSNKRVIIVSSSLWITFVDKIREDTVSRRCWSGPPRSTIGLPIYWTPGWIGIPCHCPFAYVIFL